MQQSINAWNWRNINGLAIVLVALVAVIAMSSLSNAEYRKTVAALEAQAAAKSVATFHCDRVGRNDWNG